MLLIQKGRRVWESHFKQFCSGIKPLGPILSPHSLYFFYFLFACLVVLGFVIFLQGLPFGLAWYFCRPRVLLHCLFCWCIWKERNWEIFKGTELLHLKLKDTLLKSWYFRLRCSPEKGVCRFFSILVRWHLLKSSGWLCPVFSFSSLAMLGHSSYTSWTPYTKVHLFFGTFIYFLFTHKRKFLYSILIH